MIFEEYWGEDPDPGKITAKHAWNAGQAAEREKYAELIAAAEAVLSQMVVEIESTGQLMEWHTIACDVLERMNNENFEIESTLEQALKLVSKYHARKTVLVDWEKSVIKDIEARLAEDDEEPYAWVAIHDHHGFDALYFDKQEAVDDGHSFVWPLYRHPPPARKLTDEEIFEVVREASRGSALMRDGSTSLRIARAIERRINGAET